jgi:hypothetical protein
MIPPPNPDMRRAAVCSDSPKSQSIASPTTGEYADETLVRQSRKLQSAYFFCRETARTYATLAYGVVAR